MAGKKKLNPNYMDMILIRNPERKWSEREDGIVVIDIEHKGFFHKIAQKFFKKPRVSHIALDVYGTALWSVLDGEKSVFDIVNHMKKQFPDEEERMLDRTVTFLYTLQKNRFVVRKEQ